jgi:predicted enzyme related to lactoylglutathione lyase
VPDLENIASPVTHFEIYAETPAKLVEFYRNLFGWEFEQVPGIAYWRIHIGAGDGGNISGGLLYRPIAGPRSWVHYVHVAALDAIVKEVKRLGGSVLRPKTAVPRTAWYAVVADPEGNNFAVWQADPSAFPPPEPD